MTYEELSKKHSDQWNAFFKQSEDNSAKLVEDEGAILDALGCSLPYAPEGIRTKIERDRQAWRDEWGMDGRRSRIIRGQQQREREKYFDKLQFVNKMKEQTQEKAPELVQ